MIINVKTVIALIILSIGFEGYASSKYAENKDLSSKTFELVEENYLVTEPYNFQFLSYNYIGLPGVYSHKIFLGGFLAKRFPFRTKGSFLEIGTGTGVYAIHAALNGADRVVATDINLEAVKNSKINAIYHGVEQVVDIRTGSIFEPISKNEKFDVIYWNIPIGHTEKKDLSILQQAVFDPNYELMKTFLCNAYGYLEPKGELLMTYSKDIGDLDVMQSITQDCGLSIKTLYEEKMDQRPSIELYSFFKD